MAFSSGIDPLERVGQGQRNQSVQFRKQAREEKLTIRFDHQYFFANHMPLHMLPGGFSCTSPTQIIQLATTCNYSNKLWIVAVVVDCLPPPSPPGKDDDDRMVTLLGLIFAIHSNSRSKTTS